MFTMASTGQRVLNPDGGSQKATLVVLLVVISSLKPPRLS